MLTERHLSRYADVMVWALKTARKRPFKKGDTILIRFHLPAVRMAEILNERLLKAGMNPVLRLSPTPVMERDFFLWAGSRQLDFVPPGEKSLYESLNGSIFLYAPESITHLGEIDPTRIARAAVVRKPFKDILDRRDDDGAFGWTLCLLPTPELIRHSGMTEKAYVDQVVRACFLNRTQPVEEWRKVYRNAQRIKKWLNSLDIGSLHVESATTDLTISPGRQRRWIGLSGHNIPSFELFLSPDWRGTNGVYVADQPSFRNGNRVEGVRLEFRKGRLTGVQAETGEDFLKKQVRMDAGAARIGEFSLTDKRFSKINGFMANTLYDENYGGRFGNCHLALGSAYSDTFDGDPAALTPERKKELGFNDSALHWDLVNTEKKRVAAHFNDGRRAVIYENGRFMR
ncbi:MAG: aminopeptidase [Desulfobacterales bacterium]|jgi:aminopeptidase